MSPEPTPPAAEGFAYLLDGALLRGHPHLSSTVNQWLKDGCAIDLYDTLPAELQGLGPILCQPQPEQINTHLDALSALGQAHGASLLLLRPQETWQGCAEHLRRCAVAIECEDGSRFHLRFADTRVFSVLPDVMTASQWERFASPWTQWRYIDRKGRPATLVAQDIHGAATGAADGRWTDDQLHRLAELGWPDQLVHEVLQLDAKWLAKAGNGARHALASEIHARARDAGKVDDLAWQMQACLDAEGGTA